MIPKLYQKDGTTLIGTLTNCIECLVEEERNGLFEITLTYPNEEIASSLEYDNIIICDANDTLKNQKFRIYDTRRMMNDTIDVYARHISFDLAYDYINSIDITNQSCEYALNTIFRSSQFSTGYVGHSDIVNAQNYKISNCNALEAIAGKQGSIIDTYGTGAEILRDNTDIYVLNRRGNDNGVSIEYAKNLTGFELQENTDDLITRIIPFATYTPEGGEQTRVQGTAVDSSYINNYSHPFIAEIDFSDKFEDNEVPTPAKLNTMAQRYFEENKCDLPKQNWKIEFIPLSKCVGYESIKDAISLCDTVTIRDTRYNIDTKAKVIKTVYDVLRERYDSMELGEPRTTLGDIVNTGNEKGEQGPPGPQGPKGEDGNIGDFPDSVPAKPVLTTTLLGFASIQLDWTYENKPYYWYELYASKTKDFTPNVFDIVHKGQTSSFLYQAKPGETWYFRVCGINSYDHRGEMSDQVEVVTTKIDNLENYFTTAAIGQAVVGSLTADYMTSGIIKGNWIDAKNLSVTDGNGKRTLDIDSYGNVNLDVTSLKISSKDVATKENLSSNLTNSSIQYYLSTSQTSLAGGSWQDTAPTWEQGKYMWQRMKYTKYNGTVTYGNAVCIAGAKGDTGEQGPQGVPGTDGKDGVTYYTWIKYADSSDGSGISNNPTGKTYIGFAYNKTTPTESNTASDYTWSLIKGTDGVPGTDGKDGATTYTWIKYSDNSDGAGLYDTPKDTTKYIGIATNKTTATESTNKSDYVWSLFRGEDGIDGTDGKGLVSSTPQWYLSTSNTTQTGGSWQDTMPTVTTNKYIWTRFKNVWENPTSTTYTTPVLEQIAEATKEVINKQAEFKQDLDGFKTTVSETYITKTNANDTYATKSALSEVKQTADSISTKVDKNGVISSINQSPETIRLNANRIDLQGAVSAGGISEGNYVYIAKENYNVYRNNINTMTIGTVNKDENIVPAVFMGANGHSGGANYGALFHMGNRQVLSHYNSERNDWSEISLYSNGTIDIAPAGGLILNSGAGIGVNSHMFPHNQATIYLGYVNNPYSSMVSKEFVSAFDGVQNGSMYGRENRFNVQAGVGHDLYLTAPDGAIDLRAKGELALQAPNGIFLNGNVYPYNQETIHFGQTENPISDIYSKNYNMSFEGYHHGDLYGRTGRVTLEAQADHDVYLANPNYAVAFDVNGHFKPTLYNISNLGAADADNRWKCAYLLSNPDISSDERLKEEIEYVPYDDSQVATFANIEEAPKDNITLQDMYNFIRDEYYLAQFRYKGFENKTLGFIAQDVADTKIGSRLVTTSEDGYYSYDSGYRQGIVEGTLQVAISKIESQEKTINKLQEEINQLAELVNELINKEGDNIV